MKKLLSATVLAAIVVSLSLSSCAVHTETNKLIAESNKNAKTGFADALVACSNNAACQVGVSLAFATNLGEQKFFKEDSWTDYLRAAAPILGLGLETAKFFASPKTSGDSGMLNIIGDNNQVSGVANKLTADHESSVNATFTSTNTITHQAYTLTDGANFDASSKTELAPEVPLVEEEEVIVE